jgi:hypothetical protein
MALTDGLTCGNPPEASSHSPFPEIFLLYLSIPFPRYIFFFGGAAWLTMDSSWLDYALPKPNLTDRPTTKSFGAWN